MDSTVFVFFLTVHSKKWGFIPFIPFKMHVSNTARPTNQKQIQKIPKSQILNCTEPQLIPSSPISSVLLTSSIHGRQQPSYLAHEQTPEPRTRGTQAHTFPAGPVCRKTRQVCRRGRRWGVKIQKENDFLKHRWTAINVYFQIKTNLLCFDYKVSQPPALFYVLSFPYSENGKI